MLLIREISPSLPRYRKSNCTLLTLNPPLVKFKSTINCNALAILDASTELKVKKGVKKLCTSWWVPAKAPVGTVLVGNYWPSSLMLTPTLYTVYFTLQFFFSTLLWYLWLYLIPAELKYSEWKLFSLDCLGGKLPPAPALLQGTECVRGGRTWPRVMIQTTS